MAGSFDLNSTLEFIFYHQNSEDGSGSFFFFEKFRNRKVTCTSFSLTPQSRF